jgi:hypothetical protein
MGPDEPVDPGAARHRAAERRRNSRALAGIAVALVLVAGVIGVPRLLPGGIDATSAGVESGGRAEPEAGADAGAEARTESPEPVPQSASSPPVDPAPEGWRIEYYGDTSFQVPASWRYAVAPQSDWCADEPPGQPRPEQRRPYVWLGRDISVRTIGCPEPPTSLLTEHVEALAWDTATSYVDSVVQKGEWWVVTRNVGYMLSVTTKDRSLAERILDSVRTNPADPPCAPLGPPISLGARPSTPTELTSIGEVDRVALCQYAKDNSRTMLQAARVVTGPAAHNLVAALRSAPVDKGKLCDSMPLGGHPEIFVLVRIVAGGQPHEVYVSAMGCPGSERGMVGGIDDGTTLRLLTRDACGHVLTPPIAIYKASGAVAENCLG